MSLNPVALDFQEAQSGFRELSKARRAAREEFEKQGLAEAEAEYEYRRGLAAGLAIHRAEGKGAGEAEILARGDVAHHKRSRDRAHVFAKAADLRIAELESDRASLNKLAEWSMRLSPTGEPMAA